MCVLMCVCVSVCVCVYVCAHVCVYVYVCAHVCVFSIQIYTDLPSEVSIKLLQCLQTFREVITIHLGIKR